MTNNRIYYRSGVPIFTGSVCSGVKRPGNLGCGLDDAPCGTNQVQAAAVSASSNNADAAKVQDNKPATAWTGTSTSNQRVQIDFKKSRRLDQLAEFRAFNAKKLPVIGNNDRCRVAGYLGAGRDSNLTSLPGAIRPERAPSRTAG
jgi:hypothetical protein